MFKGFELRSSAGFFPRERCCLIKFQICESVSSEYFELCGIQIFKFIASIHLTKL